MNRFRSLISDFLGLSRVLGNAHGLRWLWKVLEHLPEIIREGNLQAADRAMGDGPFMARYAPGIQFWVKGPGVITSVREMLVRDRYLRDGLLRIRDGDHVVDLGAHMGNFTKLALAHGSKVTVTSVEPGIREYAWSESLVLNPGFVERAQLFQVFLGLREWQEKYVELAAYAGSRSISEQQLLAEAKIERIDLLKCDIEGSEFVLLTADSRLLALAKQIAIEVHADLGDVDGFIAMLRQQGFKLLHVEREPSGDAIVLATRED